MLAEQHYRRPAEGVSPTDTAASAFGALQQAVALCKGAGLTLPFDFVGLNRSISASKLFRTDSGVHGLQALNTECISLGLHL